VGAFNTSVLKYIIYRPMRTGLLNVTRVSSLLPLTGSCHSYLSFIYYSLLFHYSYSSFPLLSLRIYFVLLLVSLSVVSTHPTESELLLYPSYFLFTYPTITDLPTYNRLVLLFTTRGMHDEC
jgi:hypothetical protein